MGRGAIVIGLAAVIIGKVIFGKIFRNFALKLLAVSLGAVLYYVVIQVVLWLGLNTDDLKLLTALVVALFLSIPLPGRADSVRQSQKGGVSACWRFRTCTRRLTPARSTRRRRCAALNLSLEDGDFATVIGGNGAGKSTLLNAVAGVWPIDSGTILIDGVDVTPPARAQARQLHRPRVSGSHDGHGRQHADRGEPGPGHAPRPDAHPAPGHYERASERSTASCSPAWAWAWRIA